VIKEAKALNQQMNALVQQPGDLPLLVAVAADIKQKLDEEAERVKSHKPYRVESSEQQAPAAQKAQLLAGLQAAIAAVDATATPQEARNSSSGSMAWATPSPRPPGRRFLRHGGQQVSAAEAAVLVEIKTVLGCK